MAAAVLDGSRSRGWRAPGRTGRRAARSPCPWRRPNAPSSCRTAPQTVCTHIAWATAGLAPTATERVPLQSPGCGPAAFICAACAMAPPMTRAAKACQCRHDFRVVGHDTFSVRFAGNRYSVGSQRFRSASPPWAAGSVVALTMARKITPLCFERVSRSRFAYFNYFRMFPAGFERDRVPSGRRRQSMSPEPKVSGTVGSGFGTKTCARSKDQSCRVNLFHAISSRQAEGSRRTGQCPPDQTASPESGDRSRRESGRRPVRARRR